MAGKQANNKRTTRLHHITDFGPPLNTFCYTAIKELTSEYHYVHRAGEVTA